MNRDEFVGLQHAQLQIMDEIHRICTENNIKYYLAYGSAIGAVRHQGFIPWDVDIDVVMLREDYERFKEVCVKQSSERFAYFDYSNIDNFDRPHALFCMKNTYLETFFDKYNEQQQFGIFVDIIPLDNVPDDDELAKRQQKRVYFLRKLRYRKLSTIYDDRKVRAFIKKMGRLLFIPVSMNWINKECEKVVRQYQGIQTHRVCSFIGQSLDKNTMPREYFGDPQITKFEGRDFYIPSDTHNYLSRIYGDYMKLPPVEQRQENLDYFVKVIFDD